MKLAKDRELPTGTALRRHLARQLRIARRAWLKSPRSRKAVHTVRKRLKRVRAVLRLLRPVIGDHCWRATNRALRKIARRLSPLREAQVDWRTCHALALPSRRETTPLRGLLRSRVTAARRDLPGKHALGKALRAAQDRVEELPFDEVTDRDLRAGLTRLRQATRRAADRARTADSVEFFHGWRKCVKDLGYVLPVLLGKDAAKEQVRALDKLGDLLGEEHDLALFEALVASELAGSGHDRLVARIVKRRAALREKAVALGTHLA